MEGLTGLQLLSMLKNMTPDQLEKKVVIAYNYGDRSGSIVTEPVTNVNFYMQVESPYHNGHKIPKELNDEAENEGKYEEVIVLSDGHIEQY